MAVTPMQITQFITGSLNASLVIAATLCLIFSRSLFRTKLSYQRLIYVFILLNNLVRMLVSMILDQLDPEPHSPLPNPFYNKDNTPEQTALWAVRHTAMAFDVIASLFNFSIYLILLSFWAEQFFVHKAIRQAAFSVSADLESGVDVDTIRKLVSRTFWSMIAASYILTSIFVVITFFTEMESYSTEYLGGRLAVRLTLSLLVSLGLIYFGVRLFSVYRQKSSLQREVRKIAVITLICSGSYLLLSTYNAVTFAFHQAYMDMQHRWVISCTASIIEILANGLLLFILRPATTSRSYTKAYTPTKPTKRTSLASMSVDGPWSDSEDTNLNSQQSYSSGLGWIAQPASLDSLAFQTTITSNSTQPLSDM